MDKEIIPEEEYSKAYSDLKKLAQVISNVFDSAYAIYSPMVNSMVKSPRTPDAQVERIMDGLMDYADDPRFVELYKKLCKYVYRWYPDLVKEHVVCFLEYTREDSPNLNINLSEKKRKLLDCCRWISTKPMMYYELTNPNEGAYIMDYCIENEKSQATPVSQSDLTRASRMITRLAEEHGVTEAEVRSDLLEAMQAGMENSDPNVQKQWKSFHFAAKEPTVEEFLSWVIRLSSFSAK